LGNRGIKVRLQQGQTTRTFVFCKTLKLALVPTKGLYSTGYGGFSTGDEEAWP